MHIAGTCGTRIGYCKTVDKKEERRFKISKSISDAVLITPSQFVVENQGVLTDSYEFRQELGQGRFK